MPERVLVGYWCPRGGGHVDLLSDPEGGQCGSKGTPLWMDVDPGDALDLPGWMTPVEAEASTAEAVATVLRAAADRMRDEAGWLEAHKMTAFSPASWIVAAMRDELQQVAAALESAA